MSDTEIEERVQSLGLTAPRITLSHIQSLIIDETYTTLPSGKVMVCELTLRNGFTVRGEAAVVSRENFNEEIGRRVSRENAVRQIWQLEGYLLQERLAAVPPSIVIDGKRMTAEDAKLVVEHIRAAFPDVGAA